MDQLIANIDNIVLSFVQGSFGSLTSTVLTFWHLMFIVFIAVYGYKIFISGKFLAADLILHCVRIIIVLVLATKWAAFFQFIYSLVTNLPSDISGQIMQAASNSLGTQAQAADVASANTLLAQFYNRALTVCSSLLEGAGWGHFGLYFYAAVVWIGAGAFTGYATMLIILSKLAVAVILALGPIFILLLIFQDTKNLFDGWLRALLSYALVPIFVYSLLALLLAITTPPLVYLENHSGVNDQLITAIGPFAITTYIATMLLRQIMGISSNITGGASLSIMGGLGQAITGFKYLGETTALSSSKSTRAAKIASNYAAEKFRAGRDAIQQSLSRKNEVL